MLKPRLYYTTIVYYLYKIHIYIEKKMLKDFTMFRIFVGQWKTMCEENGYTNTNTYMYNFLTK